MGCLTHRLTLSVAEVILLLPGAISCGAPGACEVVGAVGGRHDPV